MYAGIIRLLEFVVVVEEPELEILAVELLFTLGCGSLWKLVLSLGGGDGAGVDVDEIRGERSLLVVFLVVAVLLPTLLLGYGVYVLVGGGGGGMTRPGPFDGKSAAPSASAEA